MQHLFYYLFSLTELGDIITKIGGQVIDVEADLFQALEDLKPGDTVEVTVNRVVAVNDELQMKEVVLRIELQASTQIEKYMQLYQYSTPAR
jgi:S1-C subfamily serine protease